jgi:hypothetical protein
MSPKNSKSALDSISRRNFLAMSGTLSAAMLAPAAIPGAFASPLPTTAAAPAAGDSTADATAGAQTAAAADTTMPADAVATKPKKYPIGLELYSVRDELARDLPNTLKTVAKIGYEIVEVYAPYYDWSIPYAKEVRTQMDDLGLKCYSTHNHTESFTPGEGMAKAIELNQILGAKIIVLASANAHGL